MDKISILSREQIEQKTKRMAYEIWERNCDEKEIIIIGIAPGGFILAENLCRYLKTISPLKIHLHQMEVNKPKPLKDEGFTLDADLNGKSVVLVDDVANSGKTLLYALRPLLKQLPSKILIAVLVNRHHKNFPVVPDIVGYSILTTLQEHIDVTFENTQFTGAYLE